MNKTQIIKYVKSLSNEQLLKKVELLRMPAFNIVYEDKYCIKGDNLIQALKRILIYTMLKAEEDKSEHIKSNKEKKDAIENLVDQNSKSTLYHILKTYGV